MKKIIILAFLAISTLCYSQEPELSPVNISIDKIGSKPALIFSEHFDQCFINLRTAKGNFNFRLKYLAGHTQGGLTERGYSVIDEKGNKINEIRFVHTYGVNYGDNKKLVNSLTMYNYNSVTKKESESVILLIGI